jgi:peptidylprolyl isomerase
MTAESLSQDAHADVPDDGRGDIVGVLCSPAVASAGLASLPLLIVVMRCSTVLQFRKLPAGILLTNIHEAAGSICAVSSCAEVDGAVVFARVRRDARSTLELVDGQLLRIIAASASYPHEWGSCMVIPGDKTLVVAGRLAEPQIDVFECDGTSLAPLQTVKCTPHPVARMLWAGQFAILVDLKGFVEYIVDVVAWRPHPLGHGPSASRKHVSWTLKAKTGLFQPVKDRCERVLDAVLNQACRGLVVLGELAGSRRCWIFDLLSGDLRATHSDLSVTVPSVNQSPGTCCWLTDEADLLVSNHGGVWVRSCNREAVQRTFTDSPTTFPREVPACITGAQEIRDIVSQVAVDQYPELSATVPEQPVLIACQRAASHSSTLVYWSSTANSAPAKLRWPPRPSGGQREADVRAVEPELLHCSSAQFDTTLGTFACELMPDVAPKAVHNFVGLASKGFYNGLTFHRVIKGFMIQGGCPRGDGTSGESVFGAPFEDEIAHPPIPMTPLLLCMANRGPCTNESQFFVTTSTSPWLDGKHTVFGRVVEGQDVVTAIESTPTSKHDAPLRAVVIRRVSTS